MTTDTPPRAKPAMENSPPALAPPQFTLRTLFWVITGLCGLLTAMTAAGPIGGFALLLLVLAIVAHVVGNAMGQRLREIGSDLAAGDDVPARRQVLQDDFAPAGKLSQRTRVGLVMLAFTVAGAVIFGAAGGALLIWLAWEQLNVPTAIVAVSSSCVLGGLLGFSTSSFTQIAGGAWWEAQRGARR